MIAIAMIFLVAACGGDVGGGDSGGGGSSSGGDNSEPTSTPEPTPSNTPDGGDVALKPDPGDGGQTGGGQTSPEPTPTPGDGSASPEPTPTPGDGSASPEPAPTPGGGGSTSPEPTPTPGGGGSTLSGSASEVLEKLVADLVSSGVSMPMSFPGPPPEVSAEMSHNTIGLSEDDFNRLVASASYSQAAIGTFAHQINIIQANDPGAAAEVKSLVSGANGFDPQKWICVYPDRVSVVESGNYVLLTASTVSIVEASIDSFKAMAGSIGSVVSFWEFSD